MGLSVARLIVLATGVVLTLTGLWLITLPGAPGSFSGIATLFIGLALIVAAVIERVRYRADPGEPSGAPRGPGGGAPQGTAHEARIRPTSEVFVDPTSGHTMRVWSDATSGERRYRAEAADDRS